MKESWLNINAINDSIKAGFSILDKTVVSVMRGNAGAGGAMAAMASDLVWAHENVILNPHYKVYEVTIRYIRVIRNVIFSPPYNVVHVHNTVQS